MASQQIKSAIIQAMKELSNMSSEELIQHRMLKHRHIGSFQEGIPIDPKRKHNMKPSQSSLLKPNDKDSELKDPKKHILKANGPNDPITAKSMEKLKQDIDKEIANAFISMGLKEKLESLKQELSKSPNGSPNLKGKTDKIMQEFKQKLSKPGSYLVLKQKLEKLDMINNLIEHKKNNEKLRAEINSKIPPKTKANLKQLKDKWDSIVISKGAPMDKNIMGELKRVKAELVHVLKTTNLDVIGVVKKTADIEREEINGEIEKAIEMAGLGVKIEEMKFKKMADGLNMEEVEKVEAEIKEKIVEALETSGLKEKVESLTSDSCTPPNAAPF